MLPAPSQSLAHALPMGGAAQAPPVSALSTGGGAGVSGPMPVPQVATAASSLSHGNAAAVTQGPGAAMAAWMPPGPGGPIGPAPTSAAVATVIASSLNHWNDPGATVTQWPAGAAMPVTAWMEGPAAGPGPSPTQQPMQGLAQGQYVTGTPVQLYTGAYAAPLTMQQPGLMQSQGQYFTAAAGLSPSMAQHPMQSLAQGPYFSAATPAQQFTGVSAAPVPMQQPGQMQSQGQYFPGTPAQQFTAASATGGQQGPYVAPEMQGNWQWQQPIMPAGAPSQAFVAMIPSQPGQSTLIQPAGPHYSAAAPLAGNITVPLFNGPGQQGQQVAAGVGHWTVGQQHDGRPGAAQAPANFFQGSPVVPLQTVLTGLAANPELARELRSSSLVPLPLARWLHLYPHGFVDLAYFLPVNNARASKSEFTSAPIHVTFL